MALGSLRQLFTLAFLAILWVAAPVRPIAAQEPFDDYAGLLRRLELAESAIVGLEAADREPIQQSGALAYVQETDEGLAGRLKTLEEAWADFQEEQEAKKLAPPKEPTFEVGGRIHFDYWGFPDDSPGIGYFENPSTGVDPQDRFAFRRIRMEFGGDIFETMLWRMQIDFKEPSEPEYKDVYIGFQALPCNQVFLIGNQKRPLGLDHLNSSRYNVFMERPLVIEAFNQDARRIGAAMYGHNDAESITWRYGIYNLENTAETGQYVGDSLQMSGNARLSYCPWYDECSDGRGYYHCAIAGMLARPDGSVAATDANNNEAFFESRPEARSSSRWIDTNPIPGAEWYEILGLESMLNIGALQITGEYQNAWVQRDATTPGTGPDLFYHGAYLYVSYTLTGEHIPYDRKTSTLGRLKPFENFFLVDRCDGDWGTGWGAWQVAARVSYLDLSDADVQGGDEQNLTLALNWYWTSHSKLQFNAIFGDIENHAPVGGYTSGNFFIVGTRFAADF